MSDWDNIRGLYDTYRKQSETLQLPSISQIERIFVFGMGGSGIVGKFLEQISFELLDKQIISLNIPAVPKYLSDKDFAIIISYSGNTRETLEVYRLLKSRGIRHVCITSDGELASLCRNKILVDKGMLPREAFVQMFLAALSIIEKIFRYPFVTSLMRFEELKPALDNVNLNFKEEPIIIYSWYSYFPAALRFKQQLNENSKIQAYAQALPEACHNEIEGAKMGTFVVLRGYREWKEMVDAFIHVLPKKPLEIKIKDKNYIAELLAMAYLADIITVRIANKRKVDWRSTERIKRYKELIKHIK